MRVVYQRVSEASVWVDGEVVGSVGRGAMLLVGVAAGDDERDAETVAEKVSVLRVHADEAGKMNRSLLDIGGEVLVVSQFTLLGDTRKGRGPSFVKAAPPEEGLRLYQSVCAHLRARGLKVAEGVFGAHMQVRLVNDGPVTLLLDTRATD